jgi:hypothetical protein
MQMKQFMESLDKYLQMHREKAEYHTRQMEAIIRLKEHPEESLKDLMEWMASKERMAKIK